MNSNRERSANRNPPDSLPEIGNHWPVVAAAFVAVLGVAGALTVHFDSRREITETASISQGLGLLRLERDVGTAWGDLAISSTEAMYGLGGTDQQTSSQARFEQMLRDVEAALDSTVPTPTWLEVHGRLVEVTEQAIADASVERAPEDVLNWGWEITQEFSGIFPSDNRGEWSGLLAAVRDAQYMVYSASDYPEIALARAWSLGLASPANPELEERIRGSVSYLDELGVLHPEGLSPFEDALDLERAANVDEEVAATIESLKGDPLVRRFEGEFDFLSGASDEAWFADPSEVGPYARSLVRVVDAGGEEVLRRAESLVREAGMQAQWRGRVAGWGGLLLFLMSSAMVVFYWKQRARIEATLREAAEVDPLTGLYNRFALFSRAHPALQLSSNAGFAALQIDLDDFKAINDRLGHSAGDEALRRFASACRTAVEGSRSIVARVGGDEFVVVMLGLDNPEVEAAELATRIFSGLAAPVETHGGTFQVKATIGIAHAHSTVPLDELLEQADLALLDAKGEQRGRAGVFGRNTRRNLIREFGNALERGHIQPGFQPIVRATDLRIVGLEVLARWRREDGSEVPAEGFVRALNALGEQSAWFSRILEAANTACDQLGRRFSGRFWLNVGVADLTRTGPDSLAMVVEASGLSPDRLGIEVMEPVCPADLMAARRTLNELRSLGVEVALDDLGSDSMPIGHLTELPLDRVKLDRSLVSRIETSEARQRVVEGLLAVAVNLHLTVVGEGVETVAEERALLQLGVTYLQGYRYGAVVSLNELFDIVDPQTEARVRGASA